MNSKIFSKSNHIKCSGKNCPNSGTIQLQVQFLNKAGYFCKNCADFLRKHNLVINLENNFEEWC